jgi:4-methyl-5(b-hydroxyethyl)-thiazole monophosphate biosynthesis
MKIFLFLADGFEEIEAIAPVDIFRRAGLDVVTVSINAQKEVSGARGIIVKADTLFDENDYQGDNLIFLPGGMPGTTNLDNHDGLKKLIAVQAQKQGKIAAICAAPSILGKMDLLKGKEAICYPGFESMLTDARISKEKMVQDSNIYTAKGPGVAIPFALEIVTGLCGKAKADEIAAALIL